MGERPEVGWSMHIRAPDFFSVNTGRWPVRCCTLLLWGICFIKFACLRNPVR
jgi:hypothetical protein